jgi:alanine dehydrogenase
MPLSPLWRESDFMGQIEIAAFALTCRQALRLYGEGALHNPPRHESLEGGTFRLEMPSEWPDHYRACKTIEEISADNSGHLGQRQAYIRLEDLKRGVEVRLEADHITDMRTGLAGALGLHFLATGPLRRIGLVGTGRVARCLALAIDHLLGPLHLRVTSRSAQNRAAFVEDIGGQLQSQITAADTLEECLQDVDAVVTAVPTPKPILGWKALEQVPLSVVIGGDSRTRQVEPEVLERAEVVVDQLEQAKKSGEFVYAQQAGGMQQINFCRLDSGEIANIGDAACGRLSAGGPRLAYFTGLAALDLFAAVTVYEQLGLNGTNPS